MPQLPGDRFSYRKDRAVPAFDDRRPLFLFDGICVLCSSGASFLMRHKADVAFASAQSDLGRELFRHYGMEIDASYLLIADGRAFTKTDGYFRLLSQLTKPWRLLGIFKLIPRPLGDWIYDRVAENRYRWFGKSQYCELLTDEQRASLLDQ